MDIVKEIFSELDRLRASKGAYGKKARQFATFLEGQPGCSDIEVLDCDVCVTDFFPGFFEKLGEIYGPIDMGSLSPEEREKVLQRIDNTVPNMARVRVHTNIKKARLTFCFNCDSTMCGNEINYPNEVDWDREHEGMAVEILKAYPEWRIKKFSLWGSTRNRICVDVISDTREFDFCQFDRNNFHVTICGVDKGILDKYPKAKDKFITLIYK